DTHGTVRYVGSLATSSAYAYWDPIKAPSPMSPLHALVYDYLLRARPDGSYEPGLATSAKITNPTTIEVKLRPGVKFSDGTPLDANAVKMSIERNRDSQNARTFDVELFTVKSVNVVDPMTADILLTQPIAAQWFVFLSRGDTFIVSPTAVKNGVDLN